MASVKGAGGQSKTKLVEQRTRLPLALKPSSTTKSSITNSNKTTSSLSSTTTTMTSNETSSSPLNTIISNETSSLPSTNTTFNEASSSLTKTGNQISASRTNVNQVGLSTTVKMKKSKSISKSQIIIDNGGDSDQEQEFDLNISIEESGGLEKFVLKPCIILYKKKMKKQSDLEQYIMEHISSYNSTSNRDDGHPKVSEIDSINNSRNEQQGRSTCMNKKVGTFAKDNKLRYNALDTENKNTNTINDSLNELENEDVCLSSSEDESEHPEEKNEINASSGGIKRRLIHRRGGAKNCGTFLLLTKEEEVQDCVQSALGYARDHGTLMSGVQLKTLMDVLNTEITKDRANTLLEVISKNIEIVPNPYFISPISKRPIYQYYGARYELEEVTPIRYIPIPTGITKQYAKKQDEKENTNYDEKNEIEEVEKQNNISLAKHDDQGKCDINKNNRSLITSTSLDKENTVGDKQSSPSIKSKSIDKNNNGSIFNDNNNANTVTTEEKISDANVNTAISYPDTHTIDSTTTHDPNIEPLNDQISPIQSAPTSSPLSLNFSTSTPKKKPATQSKNKNIVTGGKISKRYSKRRSIFLRSKTQKKQEDLSGITSKRKQDDLRSYKSTSNTSSKKKKVADKEKKRQNHELLPENL
ncbi:unnamed protein product [Adineta steineri]|uniref:Uncharacterized protein n=1 Tax=Adineta steineri TaxID=433720 RepID=A0A816E7U6_9BILA|nr:unnamed protein product [Adineta steineri]CAF1643205.1 unnamed protein product [Adineta steineri]